MSGNFAIKGGGGGPLMANALLNFHFDYLNPSLRKTVWILPPPSRILLSTTLTSPYLYSRESRLFSISSTSLVFFTSFTLGASVDTRTHVGIRLACLTKSEIIVLTKGGALALALKHNWSPHTKCQKDITEIWDSTPLNHMCWNYTYIVVSITKPTDPCFVEEPYEEQSEKTAPPSHQVRFSFQIKYIKQNILSIEGGHCQLLLSSSFLPVPALSTTHHQLLPTRAGLKPTKLAISFIVQNQGMKSKM